MSRSKNPTEAQSREVNKVCDTLAEALGLGPEDIWYRWSGDEFEVALTVAQAKELMRRAGIKVTP